MYFSINLTDGLQNMKSLPYDITSDSLNIIIGICTLIIALISFSNEFSELKGLNFAKNLWFKIPSLLIFSCIIIWCTVIKDQNNDVRNANDLYIRDSTNQKKFNESLKNASKASATATSETMAKYYLKYDSVQHLVQKILKDSSKTKVILDSRKPEFDVIDIHGKYFNDSLTVTTNFAAKYAPVAYADLKMCYVLRAMTNNYDEKNLLYVGVTNSIIMRTKLIPDDKTTPSKSVEHSVFVLSNTIPLVYVYVKGYYKDEKGAKYNFEFLNYLNVDKHEFGDLSPKEYNWIYSFINKKFK